MAQSKLEEIMPSYKHDRNPYFELSKMPNYAQAVQKPSNGKYHYPEQVNTILQSLPEYINSQKNSKYLSSIIISCISPLNLK